VDLEFRVEAQNVFNHVNLGNPDSTVGVPGTTTPTRLHHRDGSEPRPAEPPVRVEAPVLTA
jgi:hypothetical protein